MVAPAPMNEESASFHIFGFHVNETMESVLITLAVLILVFTVRIAYSKTPLTRLFPDSSFTIIVGIVIGLVVYLIDDAIDFLEFDHELFFLVLIPPIIFESGYFLQKNFFFHNIGEILTLAVVGTLLNTLLVGFALYGARALFHVAFDLQQILAFASLSSAVDPVAVIAIFEEVHVNDTLFIITFGESVLNDAVSIVLYNLFIALDTIAPGQSVLLLGVAKFAVVFVGGVLIGALVTLALTFLAKFTGKMNMLEVLIPYVIGFACYALSDALLMSGIVAILFAGVLLARYNEPNMHKNTSIAFRVSLKSISSVVEMIVFLLFGVSAVEVVLHGHDLGALDLGFTACAVLFSLAARFAIVFGLSALLNVKRARRGQRIPLKDQFVLAYSGLRGAIAFALAYTLPEAAFGEELRLMFLGAVVVFVLFSVFALGGTIKVWLRLFKVKSSLVLEEDLFLSEEEHSSAPHAPAVARSSAIAVSSSERGAEAEPLGATVQLVGATGDRNCLLARQVLTRAVPHITEGVSQMTGKHAAAYGVRRAVRAVDSLLKRVLLKQLRPEESEMVDLLNKILVAELRSQVAAAECDPVARSLDAQKRDIYTFLKARGITHDRVDMEKHRLFENKRRAARSDADSAHSDLRAASHAPASPSLRQTILAFNKLSFEKLRRDQASTWEMSKATPRAERFEAPRGQHIPSYALKKEIDRQRARTLIERGRYAHAVLQRPDGAARFGCDGRIAFSSPPPTVRSSSQ